MTMQENSFDVIRAVIHSFTGPIVQQSWPALDIADYHAVFQKENFGGLALVGQGEAEGPERAIKAAELALSDLRRQLSTMDAGAPEPVDPLAQAASR